MPAAYLLVGSNILPEENIPLAISMLSALGKIQAISTTWENPPVGSSGSNFYNLAICLETDLPVDRLKGELRSIEHRLGRIRSADKYAPRTMDLDILIYDDVLVEPRIWNQPFAVVPLAELLPEYRDPSYPKSLSELAREIRENNAFKPRNEAPW
ncbi:MAG TPA: 2-amino-4-hydroxy-6-hydroxymethyldihydropteridine diphosphokinase [Anaerolineaceae bacterium]|nr:2-amino-4-hydroxy-6-hydroxymethyldihydropteridine diphosphokinase [Anaerolineaceae bacterium]